MVYVDDMYKYSLGKFGRMKMSHMMTDTTEELLGMVDKIGLNKKWIQYPNTPNEHFDISISMRNKVVELGAKEVTTRELVEIIKFKKQKA